jgi:hypothetical protein
MGHSRHSEHHRRTFGSRDVSAATPSITITPACPPLLCITAPSSSRESQDECVQDQTLEGDRICVFLGTERGQYPRWLLQFSLLGARLVCEPTLAPRAAPGVKAYSSR